ncbi:MAG TPA: hypothetical protein VFV07_12065 [Rhizomicrobium sp.]|nr:hypothetical protein [Rhizomicrobium sp.]
MIKKLALAASFALFGTAAQAAHFDVVIDGHCNTFSIDVNFGILVAGTRGGCGSALEGGVVGKADRRRGVIMSETMGKQVVTWLFEAPVDDAGNVYVLESDGKTSEQVGIGTYHIVRSPPAGGTSGPDITAEFRR